MAAAFHPGLEYYPYREFVEAGARGAVLPGPSGYRGYIEATYDVWGTEVRLYPTELIDLGDRLVLLADMPMRRAGQRDPAGRDVRDHRDDQAGKVIRQQDFLDQAEAPRGGRASQPRAHARRRPTARTR